MYRHPSHSTTPPPPSSARKYSHSSNTSSSYSRSGAFSPRSEREVIPPVPSRNISYDNGSGNGGTEKGISKEEEREKEEADEIDQLGYIYSMRVA
jgi:hypothetical protein